MNWTDDELMAFADGELAGVAAFYCLIHFGRRTG